MATKPPLLVSACLLGVRCNHEGDRAPRNLRAELQRRFRLVPVCPEVVGGLPTPRPAAEIQPDGRVVNSEGDDVTGAYQRGAEAAVRIAAAMGVTRAVLKARSPSCGSVEVYDGTFSRTRRGGEGVTCAALRAAGVEVTSDEDPLPSPSTVNAHLGA